MERILSFIEKMRGQSKEKKHRFAFAVALIGTGFIGLVWGFILFPHSVEVTLKGKQDKELAKTTSPLSSIKLTVASALEGVSSQFASIFSNTNIDFDAEYERIRSLQTNTEVKENLETEYSSQEQQ